MNKYQASDSIVGVFPIENGKKRFEGEKSLCILNLTDIHYSHDRKNLPMLLRRIRAVIQKVCPDIITLTGDQISFPQDLDQYLSVLCDFLDGFGIPWAPILGNHEGFTTEERKKVGDFYESGRFKNILFRSNAPELGVGNYVLCFTSEGKTVHSIFMVDSHTDRIYPDGDKDYDYVYPAQMEWYKSVSDELKKENENMTVSCFLHIPPAEYEYAWQLYKKGKLKGKNANCEPVCCPKHKDKEGPYNNGFFDLARSCGTKLFLCGHDHTNTASVEYEGVTLAYSFCTRQHRYCNGYSPLATAVYLDKNDFRLKNFVWRFGKVREVDNIRKRFS